MKYVWGLFLGAIFGGMLGVVILVNVGIEEMPAFIAMLGFPPGAIIGAIVGPYVVHGVVLIMPKEQNSDKANEKSILGLP